MDLLHAGKYAVYVYPAYGLTALVLIGMTLQTLWAARAARRKAEDGPARKAPGTQGSGE